MAHTREQMLAIKAQLKTTADGAFMLADFLEKGDFCPTIKWERPKFKLDLDAKLSAAGRALRTPDISWRSPLLDDLAEGTVMVDIDANAAYLSAASSARFAFDQLEEAGPHDPERDYIDPGFYLIDCYAWNFGAPGHPLGPAAEVGKKVWVTHQSYALLREITYGSNMMPGGHWPDLRAYASFTSKRSCRLTVWTDLVRDLRAEFLAEGDKGGYDAVKLGYSQATQMWLTAPGGDKKNKWFRPDWYHTIRSQASFNMWRRAYLLHLNGCGPLQVGGTGHAKDGMLFRETDLKTALTLPKSPLRLDDTGAALGTFKRDPERSHYYWGMDEVDGQ